MNIRDRIKELRRVKASELIPSPKNWRTHPKAQKDALRGVLAEIGFAAPLVARVVRGGKLQLIDGHLRAETTPNTKVPVVVLDVTAEEADKLLLSMDPLSALAGRDDTRLEDLLGSVKFESDAVMKMLSASEWPTIDGALRGMGMKWSSTIVWAKESFVIGRRDYHAQYEPIWYGWKEGAARLVEIEDRTQSDLWNIPRPKRSDEHPTMKPVELIVRALKNSSRPGAIVFEPFSGSGSTIIAAEQTGRRCRAVELEPKYVQVAIERWEKFANAKATRR